MELGTRARNILDELNLPDDPKRVAKAIRDGTISMSVIPNLGVKTYRVLCAWAGVELDGNDMPVKNGKET